MISVLEEMAVATFRSIFVKFEGATEFQDSEIGPVPVGWDVTELGEYLNVIETGSRPKGGVKEISQGVPSIGAESIIGLGKFDFSKTKYVEAEFYRKMRRGHVEPMDILLYKDGGRPGQFEPHVSVFGEEFPFKKLCINEHVYRLRAKPPITQSYLYFWLTTPLLMEEMRRRGTGVAIPGLNSTAVKELPLLVPPRQEIERFDALGLPVIQKLLLEAIPSPLADAKVALS